MKKKQIKETPTAEAGGYVGCGKGEKRGGFSLSKNLGMGSLRRQSRDFNSGRGGEFLFNFLENK